MHDVGIYCRGDGDPGRHLFRWMNGTSGEDGVMRFVCGGAETSDQ